MSSPANIAANFTIAGLLDEDSKTKDRYPVIEIPVSEIVDHPNNSVYSMEPAGIRNLADSIKKDGLTDLPLVRKLSDGGFQMVSGHRRKAAFTLLAEDDEGFQKMPCRVIEGVDDDRSVTLLHAANYFTRALTLTEKAAATRALNIEVERRREEDKAYVGMRTEDVKAVIITEQTGKRVCGKTIKRQEELAKLVETRLIAPWRAKAEAGLLTADSIEALAETSESQQIDIYDNLPEGKLTKKNVSECIKTSLGNQREIDQIKQAQRRITALMRVNVHPQTDIRLMKAVAGLKDYVKNPPIGSPEVDFRAVSLIADLSCCISEANHIVEDGSLSGLRRD